MSARRSRSTSISVPASSSTARLENVISMPFLASPGLVGSPRPRMTNATRPSLTVSSGPTTTARRNVATSPVRSISGSYSYSNAASRSPVHSTSPPVFEPRIIRAGPSPARPVDPACFPSVTSPPTAPTRRQSTTRLNSGITPVYHAPMRTVEGSAPTTAPAVTHTQTEVFPRPTYLDHSALRDLLQTDAPISSVDARSAEARAPVTWSTSAYPISVPAVSHYPYLRRVQTPVTESEDEGSSPPPSTAPIAPNPVLMANPVLRLPTRWSEQDRHPPLSVSPDGRELTFIGPSCIGEKDSAAARANHPIPPACGIYYYEVEILHKGSKGHISLGFSSPDVRLSRLPGWEKQSWGYHADDGWSFPGHKDGSPYGPTFDTGDIIGCGVDFSQHRAFYTKNGTFLGMVFENVGKGHELYPAVGLRHTSESIRVNFGHAPFKYAIEDHVHSQQNCVWADIQSTKINWDLLQGINKYEEPSDSRESPKTSGIEDDSVKAPLRKLVLSYLAHHGYAKTAHAFQAQCERSRVPVASTSAKVEQDMDTDDNTTIGPDQELRTRVDIVNAVLRGDVDTALVQTRLHFPTVLEREQGLMLFKLRCRKFVELSVEASEALKRAKQLQPQPTQEVAERGPELHSRVSAGEDVNMDGMDGEGAMDVDDPSHEAHSDSSMNSSSVSTSTLSATEDRSETASRPRQASRSPSARPTSPHAAAARQALHTALAFGQTLEADYKHDGRPEIRAHLKRTFGVVAYTDPLAAGGEVAEMAGQEARVRLGNELNQAILESQGKPVHPALEMLYRQSAACITQLGLLNVGSAAFADMPKEFLEG
ncbi:SPRY-domain-containing protein [Cristinia sonorae]|uniref:SPRY-domain-containing protein n=1 Tax=Cristinia sonorae TaxID=1940300 RepID=A0A8K0UQ60_9AGAR|nr:SPRY-domain-containing protein [Cristinia sonorae]